MERFATYPRTLCFVLSGDDVLLLRGAPTKRFYANLYNGVGGHVERGEDVLSSLYREVYEETGLTIARPRLRALIVADEGNGLGVLIFVYTAPAANRNTQPSAEGELIWAPRSRVLEYNLVPDLRELLPRLFALPADSLLYGHYGPDGIMWRESGGDSDLS